jgi:signal transduction histidine kinase/ligand-binding sensor domain-containing protein
LLLAPLLLARATPGGAAESDYLVRRWTVDDGLPGVLLTRLAQSEDGYLWLGTDAGLVRFDGERFIKAGDAFPGAESASPESFYQSSAGPRRIPSEVWCVGGNGSCFAREGGVFKRIASPFDGAPAPVFMSRRADGSTLVGYRQGVVQRRNGRWLTQRLDAEIPDYALQGREEYPGEWWCRRGDELGRWRAGRFEAARDTNGDTRFPRGIILGGLDHGAWILRDDSEPQSFTLFKIAPDLAATRRITVPWGPSEFLEEFIEDHQGNVWLSSRNHGVLRYGRDGQWEPFNSLNRLSTDATRAILEDIEGNIWLATDGGGLYRLSKRTFRTFGFADGLTTENVYAVAPARDGGVWVGTMGSQLDGLFHILDGRASKVPRMGPYDWSVHEDAQGDVWAGTFESGLLRLHNGQSSAVPGSPANMYALCDDGRGGLWFGGRGIGRVVDGKAEKLNVLPRGTVVNSLARQTDGTLWIGSPHDGLYSLKEAKLAHYLATNGLLSDKIYSLYVDKADSLWVGTDDGIDRLVDGHFKALAQKNGLEARLVSGMAEDRRGNFWIHSFDGIYRTSRRELDEYFAGKADQINTIRYGRDDGLATAASTKESQPHLCQDKQGRMWFATLNGAAMVDPASMPENPNPPPVALEEIKVNGKAYSADGNEALARPAQFPAGSRQIEIHFTANCLTAPGKVRFRYRLEGSRPEWIDLGDRRSVTFDQLAHGQYRFQVIARNNDGVWNERGAAFAFMVLPFFWETKMFQGSLAFLALGLAIALARYFSTIKLRRRLAVAEQQAAIERERSRISRDMHDELGARLTKIAILGDLAERNLADSANARGHLRSLSDLARDTGASLSELIWTVKPANDTLPNLVNHLCERADEFFRETEVKCRFDIPDQIASHPASAEVRQEVSLAVNEALNNIIKHSGATEVRLEVQAGTEGFVVAISDNGRGLSPNGRARPGGGNGLANMRKRLEKIGGRCEFGPAPSGGLRVTLTVPSVARSARQNRGRHSEVRN